MLDTKLNPFIDTDRSRLPSTSSTDLRSNLSNPNYIFREGNDSFAMLSQGIGLQQLSGNNQQSTNRILESINIGRGNSSELRGAALSGLGNEALAFGTANGFNVGNGTRAGFGSIAPQIGTESTTFNIGNGFGNRVEFGGDATLFGSGRGGVSFDIGINVRDGVSGRGATRIGGSNGFGGFGSGIERGGVGGGQSGLIASAGEGAFLSGVINTLTSLQNLLLPLLQQLGRTNNGQIGSGTQTGGQIALPAPAPILQPIAAPSPLPAPVPVPMLTPTPVFQPIAAPNPLPVPVLQPIPVPVATLVPVPVPVPVNNPRTPTTSFPSTPQGSQSDITHYANGRSSALAAGNLSNYDTQNLAAMGRVFGAVIKQDGQGHYLHVAPAWEGQGTNWINPGVTPENPDGLRVKISPIALDLDGNGRISTTGNSTAKNRMDNHIGSTVQFDLDADGKTDQVEWLSGGKDGFLVDTREIGVDGAIDGKALFGDMGGKFSDGFQKLAQLDSDQDGQLTGNELNRLGVWVDNGNGRLEAGELKSLSELNLSQISTQRKDELNERGETLMRSTANKGGMMIEDVWFASKQ